MKNAHHNFNIVQIYICKTSKNPTLHLLSKVTKEKHIIFTFKQLETANVWHFCLKNKTTHRLWKYSAVPRQAAAKQTILGGVGVSKQSQWKLVFSPWKVWRDVLLLAWTLCNTRLNCATHILSIRGWGRPAPAIMQHYSTRPGASLSHL